MEKYNRLVIDLYKRCFTDYVNRSPVNVNSIQEAQRVLNSAIDKAKINNEPFDSLEVLKSDIDYLKYNLL